MNVFAIFFIILALGLSQFQNVQETQAAKGDVRKGQDLYVQHCAVCHGPEGKGDGILTFHLPVPALTCLATQQKSDCELWKTIHNGGTNHVMKTWQWVLSEKDIAKILPYIDTLATC